MESRQEKIVSIIRRWASADGLQGHEPFYPYVMSKKDLQQLLNIYCVSQLSDEQQETWVMLQNTWSVR
jgi:hypothetical protein